MKVFKRYLSKSAQRKFVCYGKNSAKWHVSTPVTLTQEDIINLGLHIQSASQQQQLLWERLELYGNYKKFKS